MEQKKSDAKLAGAPPKNVTGGKAHDAAANKAVGSHAKPMPNTYSAPSNAGSKPKQGNPKPY